MVELLRAGGRAVARCAWCAALVWCVALALPLTAHAQEATPEELAAARSLFQEGRERFAAGDAAGAADRFRRALSIRPSPAIHYNLAIALERMGELVEAHEHAQAILRALPDGDTLRAQAATLAADLASRFAHLVIALEGELPASFELRLDDRSIASAVIGVAIPVDPGPHRVRLIVRDVETTADVEVASGQRATATLTVPDPPAEPVIAPPVITPLPPPVIAPIAPPPIAPVPPPVVSSPVRPLIVPIAPTTTLAEPTPTATRERASTSAATTTTARSRALEPAMVDPSPAAEGWSPDWWWWLAAGGALIAGVLIDTLPDTAHNGVFDGVDVIPVVFYAGTALFAILGFL